MPWGSEELGKFATKLIDSIPTKQIRKLAEETAFAICLMFVLALTWLIPDGYRDGVRLVGCLALLIPLASASYRLMLSHNTQPKKATAANTPSKSSKLDAP